MIKIAEITHSSVLRPFDKVVFEVSRNVGYLPTG